MFDSALPLLLLETGKQPDSDFRVLLFDKLRISTGGGTLVLVIGRATAVPLVNDGVGVTGVEGIDGALSGARGGSAVLVA